MKLFSIETGETSFVYSMEYDYYRAKENNNTND